MYQTKTTRLIKRLMSNHDTSKYYIAKKMKVSWNTVHMWFLGVYEPTKYRYRKLVELEQKLNQS